MKQMLIIFEIVTVFLWVRIKPIRRCNPPTMSYFVFFPPIEKIRFTLNPRRNCSIGRPLSLANR